MSFAPIVPYGGVAGWSFLTRTQEAQKEAFNNSGKMARDVAYFTENIAKVSSAEDLMADRRLLEVALGAFGLDEDIGNRYFIQKILEDGTLETDALANRLSDKRYFNLAKAFGFGDFDIPRTVLSDFAEEITTAYQEKQFEVAVGAQNTDMRLALGLDAALRDIAAKKTTADGAWFSVMGQGPVRTVFETALGLPSTIAVLDLDQQVKVFRERTAAFFGGDGEVAQFADAEKRTELRQMFLARSTDQGALSGSSGGSAALMLLQSSGSGAGLLGLLA